MEKVTVVLNEGPGSMRSWNGLRVAGGLVGVEVQVEVFLLDDGIYNAKKGQNPPEGLKELNLAAKVAELMELGVKISACGTCVETKGVKKEELVDGVEVATMMDLCQAVKTSANVLVF